MITRCGLQIYSHKVTHIDIQLFQPLSTDTGIYSTKDYSEKEDDFGFHI